MKGLSLKQQINKEFSQKYYVWVALVLNWRCELRFKLFIYVGYLAFFLPNILYKKYTYKTVPKYILHPQIPIWFTNLDCHVCQSLNPLRYKLLLWIIVSSKLFVINFCRKLLSHLFFNKHIEIMKFPLNDIYCA